MNRRSTSKTPGKSRQVPTPPTSAQEDLVQFWSQLNDEQRTRLTEHIERIDFNQIRSLHQAVEISDAGTRLAEQAGPPINLIPTDIRQVDPKRFHIAQETGLRT